MTKRLTFVRSFGWTVQFVMRQGFTFRSCSSRDYQTDRQRWQTCHVKKGTDVTPRVQSEEVFVLHWDNDLEKHTNTRGTRTNPPPPW